MVDEIAEALSGCFVDSAEVGSDLQLHDSLSTVLFDKCYDGHRMVNYYYAVLLFFFLFCPRSPFAIRLKPINQEHGITSLYTSLIGNQSFIIHPNSDSDV